MIKKIALLVMLGAAAAVLGLGLWYESIPLRFEEGRSDLPALAFNDQMMDETIEPFCQDGVWYYCLPGYIETQKPIHSPGKVRTIRSSSSVILSCPPFLSIQRAAAWKRFTGAKTMRRPGICWRWMHPERWNIKAT